MENPIYITTKSSNLLSKVAKIVVSVALIGLALMFSALCNGMGLSVVENP
jgi:putative effector of murein hydrolase LrgA (UPF0299 family)